MKLVAALYRFKKIADVAGVQKNLQALCVGEKIKGTLLLASEGINGTISGEEKNIKNIIKEIENMGFQPLNIKYSQAKTNPFLRMKVKVKNEIVTMGVKNLNAEQSGKRIKPKKWNELIKKKEVVLVDTRNEYETAIGTFAGAINPRTENFRQFPKWAKENLPKEKQTPIAMFCTGGIRCEKSTALLKQQGYKNIFHLDGGILQYLEDVPKQQSLWQGTCFVFDERVSLNHDLQQGEHILCHACRMPLSKAQQKSEKYQKGISCPHCFGKKTNRARFKERQKQMELAKQRGEPHLAANIKKQKSRKQNPAS